MKQSEIKEGVPYTNGGSIRIIVDSEAGCYGPHTVWYRTTSDSFAEVHQCSFKSFAQWTVKKYGELPDSIVLALQPNKGATVLPDNLEERKANLLKNEIQKMKRRLAAL